MAEKPDLFEKLFRKTKENLEKKPHAPKTAEKASRPVVNLPEDRGKKIKIPLTGGKLETYKICPKRFQYQYLDKKGSAPQPSSHLSFDSSIHHTMKDFYRDKTAGKEGFKLEKLLGTLEKNWDSRGYETPEDERENKIIAESGLRKYFQSFCQIPSRCIEVDYFFKIDLFGCEYSGKMDRVDRLPDGTLEIIDYKSGKPPIGGIEELSANLPLQLLFLAADVIWPRQVQRITNVYIRDGTVLTVMRHPVLLASARKAYLDIGEAIYQNQFLPIRSQNCGFCDFQVQCPVGQIPNLTPSKLRSFLECPRKFAATYVHRTGKRKFDEPSIDLVLDRALHDALTVLYRDFKKGIHSDPMGFLLSAFYGAVPKDLPEDFVDVVKATGREALNRYFLRFYGVARAKFVNQPLVVLNENFEYQATVDRIDEDGSGNLHLIDYRSGKRVLDEGEIRLDPATAAVCFAADRKWPGKIRQMTLVFLKSGEAISISVDDFVLRRGEDILNDVSRKIREKQFEAIIGFSCDRCSEKGRCQLDALSISVAKIQCMRDCPRRFKYQYIEKAPGPEGEKPYLVLSQALHDSLRNLVSQSKLIPSDELVADFKRRFSATGDFPPDVAKKFLDSGDACLRRFHGELGGKIPMVKGLAERAKVNFEGAVLNATFDRVDILPNGKFEIIDYKTSKRAMTQNEISRDISGVLAWRVAEGKWPGKVEKVTFHYLLTGEKISFSPSEQDLQRLKLAITEVADEMAKGTFEGHRNPLCPYCDYVGQCEDAKRLLLSPSKINSYQSCGLKYKMNYIDRVPKEPRPTPHLSFDRSIHYALKEFHLTFEKKNLNKNPFSYLIGKYWNDEAFTDWEENQRFKTRAMAFLTDYFQKLTGDEIPVHLETSATWQCDEYDISVQIDRVDRLPNGKLEIIDYKTGKKISDERVIHEDLTLMNMFLAASEKWPGKVEKASYYFLAAGKKVTVTPTQEQIEKHKIRIEKVVRQIQSNDFPPNRGALCAWCEFYNPCPEWKVKPFQLAGEIPEIFRKRIRLSYSKMGLFENCPRSYRKLYIDRVPPKSQPFFSFGTTIHETFENIYDPDHPIEKPSLEKTLEIYHSVFNEHREGYQNEEVENKYRADGIRQITMYYKRFIENEPFKPAFSIEDYFEIPTGKLAVMTGFIDRVDLLPDGTYEILDYKTEPTDRTQEEVDKDKQLSIYYWACETTMNMRISKLSLYMLDHDKKVSTTRKTEDLQKVVDHIDKMAARMINEQEFKPKKNKYCKSCDHLQDCPLKDEIMADQNLVSMKKF